MDARAGGWGLVPARERALAAGRSAAPSRVPVMRAPQPGPAQLLRGVRPPPEPEPVITPPHSWGGGSAGAGGPHPPPAAGTSPSMGNSASGAAGPGRFRTPDPAPPAAAPRGTTAATTAAASPLAPSRSRRNHRSDRTVSRRRDTERIGAAAARSARNAPPPTSG